LESVLLVNHRVVDIDRSMDPTKQILK
jgi:hypothetical protein